MTIFIHVEVSARELDSKLLLAVLAAERGHTVLLGDVIGAVEMPFFEPCLFHTKSVGRSPKIMSRHKRIRGLGHVITSLDEEAALTGADYAHFARLRFSEENMRQVAAVFTWGESDYKTLTTLYPSHAEKIYRTGSPRADLWRPTFRKYWFELESFPAQPFLLVSSNLGIPRRSLEEELLSLKRSGAFSLRPDPRVDIPVMWARTFAMLNAFVEAIRFLSDCAEGYEIVLRPHPGESTETWEMLLGGLPNVHVLREGSINHWVHCAFATMHNGCTTALEAVVAERPLITFLPFRQDNTPESADLRLANELGVAVRSLEELKSAVEQFFKANVQGTEFKVPKRDVEMISPKLVDPSPSLSAQQIVDVWGRLSPPSAPAKFRMGIFRLALAAKKLKGFFVSIAPAWESAAAVKHENEKFPPINLRELQSKVTLFQEILGLETVVKCTLLGDKTVLIEPVKT